MSVIHVSQLQNSLMINSTTELLNMHTLKDLLEV